MARYKKGRLYFPEIHQPGSPKDEPTLAARDLFVDAVHKEAPGAYNEVVEFARNAVERLDPELDLEEQANGAPEEASTGPRFTWSHYDWRGGRDFDEGAPEHVRPQYVWWCKRQLRVPSALPLRPEVAQSWQTFAGRWNRDHHLEHPDNAWVAEWILHSIVVGSREPGALTEEECIRHSRKMDRFIAMVDSGGSGPTWTPQVWLPRGGVFPAPVLPDFDVRRETPEEYIEHSVAKIRKVLDEAVRVWSLDTIRPKPTSVRDLRRLVHFQLHGVRPDEKPVSWGQTYPDARKALRRVADRIGLKMRRVPRKRDPRRRRAQS